MKTLQDQGKEKKFYLCIRMVTSRFNFQRPFFTASESTQGMVACQLAHAAQHENISFPMKTRQAALH